jgi:hypothetical protein
MSRLLLAGLAPVRRRRAAIGLLLGAPPLLALALLAWRQLGAGAGILVLAAATLALAGWLRQERRRFDLRWYARGLNAADLRFDDSAELLLAEAQDLAPLAQLQQQRLAARLAERAPALRPAWPRAALAASLLLALLLVLASFWRPAPVTAVVAPPTPTIAAEPGVLRLAAASLEIRPPRYTGLPTQQQDSLDARVPEGSLLRWQLRFTLQPDAVRLRLHDGREVTLHRDGEQWVGEHVLENAALYRIETDANLPLADTARQRLDVIADKPPEIRVEAPDKTLSLREDGQKYWDFDIRASDDYGLGEASLSITRAQGSGENIQVKQDSLRLRGEGDARARRYRHRIDLDALQLAAGDEVIVRFDVADRREPRAQSSRSASYILRLPPPLADDSVGMDGLVRTTLPAYFRSQRQIIIDTEALIAARPGLSDDTFIERSDALGVEQKILRLRYGQFLGEEFESGRQAPPATAGQDKDGHAGEEHKDAAAPADDHDHAAAPASKGFGDAGNVLAQFGHTHDHAEAATLLDPETKRILKVALEAMWQAEGELRGGRPQTALPHEYKALEQIKLVQQATRIYLARVGLELPPVDETRRLSGERAGLRDGSSAAQPASAADADLDALWQTLDSGAAPDWTQFDAWLKRRALPSEQALDLAAAADSWRRDAACADCRQALRDRLWPLLQPDAAASAGRAAPDAAGRAYLDALYRREQQP